MDFEVPEWLNESFIKNALEHGKDYTITVKDMKVDMPVAKGNNYVCDIFRVQVEYRKSKDFEKLRSISLIIKSPKQGQMFEEMLKMGILEKEPKMYYEFAPKLKSIFCKNDECFETKDGDLLAKSFFTTQEYVLILKDLKADGYKMADRLKLLDYDHCVLAMKALAKFHAGSVIIHESHPELVEKLGEDFYSLKNTNNSENMFAELSNTQTKLFTNSIKLYPHLDKYSNWFEKNGNSFWEKLIDSLKRDENEFNVLNHGDFWSSNILFKYNENNVPVKVIPIDLQTCRYTSPVCDIMYFMEGSAQCKVKKEHFNDIINIYLKELNENLEKLGSSKRLEKDEFEKSWEERSFFRLHSSITILPFVVADPETTELFDAKDTTMEDWMNIESNPMKGYYKNPNFIKLITKSLEEFERIGLIKLT